MSRNGSEPEVVVEVRRRAGSLREILTSRERRFLVVKTPAVERLLEIGAILAGSDVEELTGPSARAAGLELSYRMLSRRDRTEWEIRRALDGAGIDDPGIVGEIVQTLRRQGYLDDRRLTETYIRYTMQHRPAGPHLLRKKLREVGVGEDIIESQLRALFTRTGEREIATRLAAGRIDPRGERTRMVRRIQGLLTRRGFSSSVVNDICAMVLRGEITEEDD